MKTSIVTNTATRPALATLITLFLVSGLGCGDDGGRYDQGGNTSWDAPNSGDWNQGYPDVAEQPEIAYKFLAPKASRDYVFVPNETLDTVSKIDADSLAITSVPVGDRPTRLEAIDGDNRAVVLCQDSNELAIIHADVPDPANALKDVVKYVDIDPRMNSLVLAPDGRYAFAYFSYGAMEDGDPSGSLQTVSMVRTGLDEEAVFSLSVGFQVRNISFRVVGGGDTALEVTHAFIVTDTGVSVVALDEITGNTLLPVLPVSPRLLDDPLDREVYVTPSGAYAVVRDMGAPELYIVRLSDGLIQTVPMEFSATDVDLVPGGGTPSPERDRALVVVREANQVLDIAVEAAFEDPTAVAVLDAGDAVKGLGRVGGDGRFAIFYTTLAGMDELTVVDMTGEQATKVLSLRKPILGAVIGSDGKHALAIHPAHAASEWASVAEQQIAARPGYSLIDLESGFTKLVTTDVPVDKFAFWDGEAGSFVYVTFNDKDTGVARVEMVNFATLTIEALNLGSPPTDVGRVTGRGRMWINQEHPVGRMTFVNVDSGEPKTVTGFELNRFIR